MQQQLSPLLLERGGALGAVPLALGLGGDVEAAEVEPLDGAVVVVAPDHLAVAHLVAETVGGLVGVHRHVQHLLGHTGQVGEGVAGRGGRLILLLLPLLPLLLHASLLLVFCFLLDRDLFLLLLGF